VKNALRSPIEVRRSRRDPNIYLYYGAFKDKLICVVVKHLNKEGFIVTAYPTRRMGSPLYMFLVIGSFFSPTVALASSVIAGAFTADPWRRHIQV